MFWFLAIGAIALLICLAVPWNMFFGSKKQPSLEGKHVVITGGTSGIGLAMAKQLTKEGANVTILARNEERLSKSLAEMKEGFGLREHQRIQSISVDITSGLPKIMDRLEDLESDSGPVFMLINCAGTAIAAKFEDTSPEEFQRMIDVNYLGSVKVTQAILPKMKAREEGIVVFVSSQAGFLGLFGYTAYAASKFAVRGFAEALEMELKPFNISVTVSFPPDTDTPGFKEEEKGKPKETKLISAAAGLFQPDVVAKSTLDAALRREFYSSPGLDGWMLSNLCAGMTDSSVRSVVVQFFLLGVMRVIAWCYRKSFNSIVKKCKVQKNKEKRVD